MRFIFLIPFLLSYAASARLETCHDSCIHDYDAAEEDACKRGCQLANTVGDNIANGASFDQGECGKSCRDTYTAALASACGDGCHRYTNQSFISRLRSRAIEVWSSIRQSCKNVFSKIRGWFNSWMNKPNTTQNLPKPSTTSVVLAKDVQKPGTDEEAKPPVIITHIRIFGGFIAPAGFGRPWGLQDHPVNRPEAIDLPAYIHKQAASKAMVDHEMQHAQTEKHRNYFTYVIHRSIFGPFILLSFSLTLVMLILVVHVVIRAKRSASMNHIKYSPLPTYTEATSAKTPLLLDEEEDALKCKSEKMPLDV